MKIFLIGFMGSGKSHWGRLLSQKLNMPFFDLDEQVAEHAGQSIADIFAAEGEEHFRMQEKMSCTSSQKAMKVLSWLAAGVPLVTLII